MRHACAVCSHPQRKRIEERVLAGEDAITIARDPSRRMEKCLWPIYTVEGIIDWDKFAKIYLRRDHRAGIAHNGWVG